jgi:hypothetical protein
LVAPPRPGPAQAPYLSSYPSGINVERDRIGPRGPSPCGSRPVKTRTRHVRSPGRAMRYTFWAIAPAVAWAQRSRSSPLVKKPGTSPVGDEHERVGGPPDEALAREAPFEAGRTGGLQAVGRCVVTPGAFVAHDVEFDVLVAEGRRGRPPSVVPVHAVGRPENGRKILHDEAILPVVADGLPVLEGLDQIRLRGRGALGQHDVLRPRTGCRQRHEGHRQDRGQPRKPLPLFRFHRSSQLPCRKGRLGVAVP